MHDYTPGPWTQERRQATIAILDSDGLVLGEVYGRVARSPEIEQANAHLIATAPELLLVCETLHVRLFHEQGGQEDSPWAAPLALLRGVIRKACGRL